MPDGYLRAGDRRVVHQIDVVMRRCRVWSAVGTDLRATAHERVPGFAGQPADLVAAFADKRAVQPRCPWGRTARRGHHAPRRQRRSAPQSVDAVIRERVRHHAAPEIRELAVGDVDVTVTRHRDIGELDIVHGLAQLHRGRRTSGLWSVERTK